MEMVLRAPIVSQSLQRTSSSTKRHNRNACFAAQPALFGYKALARDDQSLRRASPQFYVSLGRSAGADLQRPPSAFLAATLYILPDALFTCDEYNRVNSHL